MKDFTRLNSPEAGKEWKPVSIEEYKREKMVDISKDDSKANAFEFEEFERRVLNAVRPYINDDAVRRAEGIEDPLAYYVPYHSPAQYTGIYFRINRMLSNFRDFISKYSNYRFIEVSMLDQLWDIYVMTVFWHELCHHVIEDIATTLEWMGKAMDKAYSYPIMSRKAEEGFCEFTAFSTAELRLSPPRYCLVPPLLHKISSRDEPASMFMFERRRVVLSYLYYHWKRDDPNFEYHPIVDPTVPQLVDGLWGPYWYAHIGGYPITIVPEEAYLEEYLEEAYPRRVFSPSLNGDIEYLRRIEKYRRAYLRYLEEVNLKEAYNEVCKREYREGVYPEELYRKEIYDRVYCVTL